MVGQHPRYKVWQVKYCNIYCFFFYWNGDLAIIMTISSLFAIILAVALTNVVNTQSPG